MAKNAKSRRPPSRPARPAGTTKRPPARPPAPSGVRRLLLPVGLAVATAVVVVAVLVALGNGGDGSDVSAPAANGSLLRTEPPWAPQSEGLRDRVKAAGFPPVGDESFHVHALLSVYVNGKPVPVPTNIGIDPRSGYHSPLHTHTPDGIIHFEADEPASFSLQQVFSTWGVDFTADRLGAYTTKGDERVQVYVNGQPAVDPVDYQLQQGDNIVVAYGRDGSFPTKPPDDALRNLGT